MSTRNMTLTRGHKVAVVMTDDEEETFVAVFGTVEDAQAFIGGYTGNLRLKVTETFIYGYQGVHA